MRTADTAKSDIDLAGLMLRCGDRGIEPLIVLLRPLPLRARPTVTFGDQAGRTNVEASVAPPGTAIVLPVNVAALIAGPWRSLGDLPVEIKDGPGVISGVIPIEGIDLAFKALADTCAGR